ncbi:probable serine/threonine-protein kinase nek3 [Schistocerca serialis cubense]|uniref:probable serine/threonine-protein kinase nek3 n=1 Tax=Schistocerca serialis cubense TaxID=2023355 RepID=UPI00214EF457|nr:probable serine/threonine-protein kinase nek3 [Schistocerca serialis cubense]
MKTILVLLSAVITAAVARPGSLEAVQGTIPDAASSKAPTVKTNNNAIQEANVDGKNIVRILRSLHNPVRGTFKTSRLANPMPPDSFPISDSSNDSTGTRFVDNPHIGLPFGTLLPLPDPLSRYQDSPTTNTADASTTFKIRIDSPHVGLPADSPISDSPASATIVSSPITNFQTDTSSEGAFGSSLYNILTEVSSKDDGTNKLSTGSSPASLTVNSGAVHSSSQPKSQSVDVSPDLPDASTPNSFPTHSTLVFFPVSIPTSNAPSTAGLPLKSGSANFPTNNGNTDFLVSNPFSEFLAKTVSPKFFSKNPFSTLPSTSSQVKFFQSLPVNSVTGNPQSHIPINTVSSGFLNSSPKTCPLKNIAFLMNNPPHSVPANIPTSVAPVTSRSNSVLVNSASVLLYSDTVPLGNVVNTAQGPVLVGGPSNFAIFPQQPSLDDISQVLAAHKAPGANAATAAAGPTFSSIFVAGQPVNLDNSRSH